MPSPEMEDVSAEFMDSTSSGSGSEDVTSEFLDTESPEPERPKPSQAAGGEFDNLDIDLHFDDTIPHPEDENQEAASLPGFEAVSEFDDFLGSSGSGAKAPKPQAFDDVAAVERELAESPAPHAAPRQAAQAASPAPSSHDLSTEILLKIAEELASIRGELVSLKTQLGEVKRESASEAEIEPAPSFEKEEEAAPAGGFFDEEEDETIALTGDELDNILNTADFTEEAAVAESVESESADNLADISGLSAPVQPSDTSLIDEALLPESGEYQVAADAHAIDDLASRGATPLAKAPEDTSYLETEEPLVELTPIDAEASSSEMELGDLSMNDVPLVEPDLSAFKVEEFENADLPVEPIAEIEEGFGAAGESAGIPDIELSADQVTDVEELEALPEAEEADFGGISLHSEAAEEAISEIEELAPIDEEKPDEDLAIRIERDTVKPAEPVALHPDQIPTSLDDTLFVEEAPRAAPKPSSVPPAAPVAERDDNVRLKTEIRSVLSYLDKLLDYLPEDKIEEFAHSEHFDTYKKLFEELGLV